MEIDAFIATLLLLAPFFGPIVLLAICLPRIQTSLFRYRLWALHDEVNAAVRSGCLPKNTHVRNLRGAIDQAIRSSDKVTFARLLVGFWLYADDPPPEAFTDHDLEDFSVEQMHLYCDIAPRVIQTILHHAHYRTFSGLTLGTIVRAYWRLAKKRPDVQEQRVAANAWTRAHDGASDQPLSALAG